MVKVMVTDDGERFFEEEGDLFVGAMLHNLNGKADYSACACGDAKMADIIGILTIQATKTLKTASDDWMEYIASIAGLTGALRNFAQKEINKNPDKLVQGFEELVKDL